MADVDVRVFVDEAASIIKLSPERREKILKRLEEECISKKWQLKAVSDEQWESMGAPIGFVVTLQTCLDKSDLEELKEGLKADVAMISGQEGTRRRTREGTRPRRRLSKANSLGDLDLNAGNEKVVDPATLVARRSNSLRDVISRDIDEVMASDQPAVRRKRASLGPRRRSFNSLEDLNLDDMNSNPRRRVSKSPDSRLAVLGHAVIDKEMQPTGQLKISTEPRRRRVKSLESPADIKSPDGKLKDSQPNRRTSLSKFSQSLRNLGDLEDGNKDSNPISMVSPRKRRGGSIGSLRRISKSPDKRVGVVGHDVSEKELDAVERSRLKRERSRNRLFGKSASMSRITVPLKDGDDSSLSGGRRRNGTKCDDDEHSLSSIQRRRLKGTKDDVEHSMSSSQRQRSHGSSDGDHSTRGASSNRSNSAPRVKRSEVLASRSQSPGKPTKHNSLGNNDATMKARRLARARRRSSVSHSGSPSPSRRSFARCRSESPAPRRALSKDRKRPDPALLKRGNSEPHLEHSTTESGPAQFQPSLDYAKQQTNSSYNSSDDASVASIRSSKSIDPSSAVTKDSQSGRFCYMSRGRIMYEWNQDFDTMVLLVPKPPEVPEEDVICTITEHSLQLGQMGDQKTFFHRPLGGKCVPEKSIWVPYGGAEVKGIIVHLKKANPGEKWKRPLLARSHEKSKGTKPPERSGSVPDFGSPMNNSGSLGGRRMSMGHRSSSTRGLEILEPENTSATPRSRTRKQSADLATHLHAYGPVKTSAHSVDFLMDLPNEDNDDGDDDGGEYFWGSTSSLPTYQLDTTEDDGESLRSGKKNQRRRIKKGSRQKLMKAAYSISPFALKEKLKNASTSNVQTDNSDSPSRDKKKDARFAFHKSLSGKIEAITRSESAPDLRSIYQELELDDDDDEPLVAQEENNQSELESKPSGFTKMLAAAAPLPFDADDNAVSVLGHKKSTLGSAPALVKTRSKRRLHENLQSSKASSNLPNEAPRSPGRMLTLVGGAHRGVSPASPRYLKNVE